MAQPYIYQAPDYKNRRAMCLVIFFIVMFLVVGFILTMVGNFAKPFWGPEHDSRCSFCREDRLESERHLKNCRIVGPIFLGIGVVSLIILKYRWQSLRMQRNANAGSNAGTTTTFSASQGTGTGPQYPATSYGYPQPYGQTPAYDPGGGYPQYGTGPIYPPPMQPPYPAEGAGHQQPPYPAQEGGYQQPVGNPTELPPPPSYESATNIDKNTTSPSAPPMD